jgi:hypothetical protein
MKSCENRFTSLWERILLSDAFFAVRRDMEDELQAYGVPKALMRPPLTTLDNSLCLGLEQLVHGTLSEENRDIFTWVLARYIDKLHTAAYQEELLIQQYRDIDKTDIPEMIETQMEAVRRYRCTAETAEDMLNALM